jgi:hypothetical protein
VQPKIAVAGIVMSVFNVSDRISRVTDREIIALRLSPVLYAATLFISALLLFSSVAMNWIRLPPDRSSALRTDDYYNILGIMLRKKFGW